MLDYEKLKKGFIENKPKIAIGVCFVLVFIIGFGTGRYDKESTSRRTKANNNQKYYNTDTSIKPKTETAETKEGEAVVGKVLSITASTTTPKTQSCIIKGNISSTGSKIYHMAGGAFYERTNPEQCFNTEAEALSAGYRKSSR
jgi:hypothetical protein